MSSNTFVTPRSVTTIPQARVDYNNSLQALLQNFASGSAPVATNITLDGASVGPREGMLWYKSGSNTTLGQGRLLIYKDGGWTRNGLAVISMGGAVSANVAASNGNLVVGDLVDIGDNRLYRVHSSGSYIVDVGIPPAGYTIGNADLLDNLDSTQFLRSDAADSFTQELTGSHMLTLSNSTTNSKTVAALKFSGATGSIIMDTNGSRRIVWDDGSSDFVISSGSYNSTGNKYTTSGDGAVQVSMDSDSTHGTLTLRVADLGTADAPIVWQQSLVLNNNSLRLNSNTVWHAGNDGAGSGLDADTLDGVQLSTIQNNYAANDLVTWNSAQGNDHATLLTARANDLATWNSAQGNDHATLLTARANDFATYTTVVAAYQANDVATLLTARANDLVTWESAQGNDHSTLLSARANDHATYFAVAGFAEANDFVTWNSSKANDWATWGAAQGNDHSTLLSARANDWATLLTSNANDWTTLLTARANDLATWGAAQGNDHVTLLSARSNDLATWNSAQGNDHATLLTARANDHATFVAVVAGYQANDVATLLTARSNDLITWNSAQGNDHATLLSARANDYATYLAAAGFAEANDFATWNAAKANDWATWGAAQGNDHATLLTARANDHATLLVSNANDWATLLTARANDWATWVSAQGNDHVTLLSARSNDLSTYNTLVSMYQANDVVTWNSAQGNDHATLLSARANDFNTLLTSNANDWATWASAQGNDHATLLTASANDYATYFAVTGFAEANDFVTWNAAKANDWATWEAAQGNDHVTLLSASANDFATLLQARANDFNTLLTSNANDWATWVSAQSNDHTTLLTARSNDFATWATSQGNDHATLLSARANDWATWVTAQGNDHATLLTARSNDWTTWGSAQGNDHATLLTARANDHASWVVAQTNDHNTLLTARSNDWATWVTAQGNDHATLLTARANDFSTFTTLAANDGVTLATARGNDHATLLTARSNDLATWNSAQANDWATYAAIDSLKANVNSVFLYDTSDIDNIPNGLYSWTSGTNAPVNAPLTNSLMLQANASVSSQEHQIVFGQTSLAVRRASAGVWGAWDYYATLNEDETFTGTKTFSSPIVASMGTAALPSITFSGNLNTGMYRLGANAIGFATGGVPAAVFTSTGNLRLYNTAGTFYVELASQPTANRTLTIPDAAVTLVAGTMVPTTRTITAGSGLTGGGELSTNMTINVGEGDGITVAADTVAVDSTVVRTTRTVTAGNGLTGGGALSGNITLTVGAGSGITVAATTVAVDSTVIRTTGNQSLAGTKTFTDTLVCDDLNQGNFNVGSNLTRGVDLSTDATSGLFRLQGLNAAGDGLNMINIYKGTTLKWQALLSGDSRNANGVWGTISDERLKKDIEPVSPQLEELRELNVVKYRLKTAESDSPKLIGFIAQEVQQVKPGLVSTDEENILGIKTTILVPILVKALQELADKVDFLESRITALEAN